MSFDTFLSRLRQKWREVPAGSDMGERHMSDSFLAMPEGEFVKAWEDMNALGVELRGWYQRLYEPLLRGRRVLEIGSGLGFDAMHFAGAGAHWTCCDIVDTNLATIGRLAKLRGHDIGFHLIDSLASFDRLPADFDAIWCNGSLINLPFELARQECAALIGHLRPGGRWIELAYPRERWVREGSPGFDAWGNMTDGLGTPWMEWYDLEKLRRRLAPHRMLPILEYRFSSENFVWIDLLHTGERNAETGEPLVVIDQPVEVETPAPLWSQAWDQVIGRADLGPCVTVEVVCEVPAGTPSLTLAQDGRFVAREIMVESRSGMQLVQLSTTEFGPETRLSVRNASGLGQSWLHILEVAVRRAG
jgi:SAM-dependent methyltransferase